jgi:hypothetical protein
LGLSNGTFVANFFALTFSCGSVIWFTHLEITTR